MGNEVSLEVANLEHKVDENKSEVGSKEWYGDSVKRSEMSDLYFLTLNLLTVETR